MAKRDKRGRIFEGPRGGQWTASKRPDVEALNCNVKNKKKKRKK
jgi:hypothetical protein